jgi:hypothetical protein
MSNYNPCMAPPLMESPELSPPDLIEAGAEPVLDEEAHLLRDEAGAIIYGE